MRLAIEDNWQYSKTRCVWYIVKIKQLWIYSFASSLYFKTSLYVTQMENSVWTTWTTHGEKTSSNLLPNALWYLSSLFHYNIIFINNYLQKAIILDSECLFLMSQNCYIFGTSVSVFFFRSHMDNMNSSWTQHFSLFRTFFTCLSRISFCFYCYIVFIQGTCNRFY